LDPGKAKDGEFESSLDPDSGAHPQSSEEDGYRPRAAQEKSPAQPELALSYPLAAGDEVPLLPARMLNEFVYCPRLAYLEWVQAEWADSADTAEGRFPPCQQR